MVYNKGDTLPKRFLESVRQKRSQVAFRKKDYGIWREFTWGEYYQHVSNVFYALKKMGLERGDKVSILSDNRPEWLFVDLAVQTAGAVTVGLYSESTPEELKYYLQHSETKFIFCEDQEQTDKVLEIKDFLGALEKIVVIDLRGMRSYNDPLLIRYEELESMGEQEKNTRDPECSIFESAIKNTNAEDVAIMAYTSGTTGSPKGVLLTHKNMITTTDSTLARDHITDRDLSISYLPLSWLGERIFSLFIPLTTGLVPNFPETMEAEVVYENIRELSPSVLFCVPRVWENFCSSVYIDIEKSSGLKKTLFNLFMPVGIKVSELTLEGKKIPFLLKLAKLLGELFVYWPIRERLGFNRLRVAYTGGAAIGPEVFTFFHALGIKLRQIYGQTEVSGIAVNHDVNDIKPETVGIPLPGVEIKISEEDEILIKSEGTFKEYFKDPEATAKAKRNGWLHTGDKGYISPEGHLVVIDRNKDILHTPEGEEYSPQLIENRLKFSMFIKEAIVVGGREYITALIQINSESVGDWAQKNGIPYTTFRDLSSKPQVRQLISKEIQKTNQRLSPRTQIKDFRLLPKELDADDGELTRTGKIRRAFIIEKFRELVEEMYPMKSGTYVSDNYRGRKVIDLQTG